MCRLYIEYIDGSIEVETVKSWSIKNECLFIIVGTNSIYCPLANIKKFIPNYSGDVKTTTKTAIK